MLYHLVGIESVSYCRPVRGYIVGRVMYAISEMGGTRSYSVKVPKLSGGINKSESPHLVEDNQLTDGKKYVVERWCVAVKGWVVDW